MVTTNFGCNNKCKCNGKEQCFRTKINASAKVLSRICGGVNWSLFYGCFSNYTVAKGPHFFLVLFVTVSIENTFYFYFCNHNYKRNPTFMFHVSRCQLKPIFAIVFGTTVASKIFFTFTTRRCEFKPIFIVVFAKENSWN